MSIDYYIKHFVDNFIIRCGTILGICSQVIFDYRITIRFEAFTCAFITGRMKKRFKCFGKSKICRSVDFVNPQYISIGDGTLIQNHCIIEAWVFSKSYKGEIIIGNNCAIGEYTHITAANRITIGNNLQTGRFVLITDNSHGKTDGSDLDEAPSKREIISKGEVCIGNNVWIADKVSIMSGVKIGNGVIIAANSVVTHDLPSYCLAAGTPAKVLRYFK